MTTKDKVLGVLLILIITFSFSTPTLANSSPTITRLAGEDRYATASSIAMQGRQQSDYAILTYGENFPDALSAVPLAKKYNAPILLTNNNSLPNSTKQSLIDLKVKNVFIVGGIGVIFPSIETELTSMGITVKRISGQDRYDTAFMVSQQLDVAKNTPVVVSYGEDFPDALAISSFAAFNNWPILLVQKDILPDKIKDFITADQPSHIYITGGDGAISLGVQSQIQSLVPNGRITRFAGQDRFDTATQIVQKFASSPQNIYLASGYGFADALAGSVIASRTGDPILLIDPNSSIVPTALISYLSKINESKSNPNIICFGGDAIVSSSVSNNAFEFLNQSLSATNGLGLTYVISIEDYSSGQAKVTMIIDKLSQNSIKITEDEYRIPFKDVLDIRAYDENNNPIKIELTGEHQKILGAKGKEWTINTQNSSRVIVEYIAAPTNYKDRTYEGYIGNNQAVFEGTQILLYPMDVPVDENIKVLFNVPSGSNIITPWYEEGVIYYPNRNYYSTQNHPDTNLHFSVGLGDLTSTHKTIGQTDVQVALPKSWDEDIQNQVSSSMFNMMEYFTNLFGDSVGGNYLIIYGQTPDNRSVWAGESTYSQAVSKSRIGYRYGGMLSHQIFHRWNGFIPFGWQRAELKLGLLFSEGNARYYETKSVIKLFDNLYGATKSDIENLQVSYEHYKLKKDNEAFYTEASSTSGDSEEQWVAYNQGALINFALDMQIVKDTNGTKSLDDLTRILNERHNNRQGQITYTEVIQILNDLTSEDYSQFFNDYVSGNKFMELSSYFEDNDNDKIPNYGEIIRGTPIIEFDQFDQKLVSVFQSLKTMLIVYRDDQNMLNANFNKIIGRGGVTQDLINLHDKIIYINYPELSSVRNLLVEELFADMNTNDKNYLNAKFIKGKLLVYIKTENREKFLNISKLITDITQDITQEKYIDFDE